MAKFVLAYRGGKMAEDPAAREAAMEKWGAWFGSLGSSVADMGAPFGESASVGSGSGERINGYSIIDVASLAAAKDAVAGCPIVADGGGVDIYTVEAM